MRFRMFLVILLFCSTNSFFGMQPEPPRGTFASVKQKLSYVCRGVGRAALEAKNLVLTGLNWVWRKKWGLALATAEKAVIRYFSPTPEKLQVMNWKKRVWEGGKTVVFFGSGYVNMALERAQYVNYWDLYSSRARRCYAEREPELFDELTRPVDEDQDDVDPRLLDQDGPLRFDGRIFSHTICEEAGSDLLFSAAAKILSNKIKLPHMPGPLLLKCFVQGFGSVIMREAIRHNIVLPCINLGMRLRQRWSAQRH